MAQSQPYLGGYVLLCGWYKRDTKNPSGLCKHPALRFLVSFAQFEVLPKAPPGLLVSTRQTV